MPQLLVRSQRTRHMLPSPKWSSMSCPGPDRKKTEATSSESHWLGVLWNIVFLNARPKYANHLQLENFFIIDLYSRDFFQRENILTQEQSIQAHIFEHVRISKSNNYSWQAGNKTQSRLTIVSRQSAAEGGLDIVVQIQAYEHAHSCIWAIYLARNKTWKS